MSLTPSIVTLYKTALKMRDSLAIGVSQSGKSPDIVEALEACGRAGAKTAAFVNVEDSPMAKLADAFFPLRAGPELSVAATKTVIAGMAALARLVGHWANDKDLLDGLKDLPRVLEKAQKADLSQIVELLHPKSRALVLGRGPTWSIALEAALKLKETCSLQAEAFSSAEVKHGPKALVGSGYPILVFAPRGPARQSILDTANEMRALGAEVLLVATKEAGVLNDGADIDVALDAPNGTESHWLDPMVIIQAFHLAAEQIAKARGLDPDDPPHLNKVTLTV
jgi:glucosamine--fructose-6-phosphate aminotransferase (isomerizing)